MRFRSRLATAPLALAVLALATGGAAAQTASTGTYKTGNWTGSAYFTGANFSHCAVSVGYTDKSNVLIQVTATRSIVFGVTKPEWNMTPNTYDVTFAIGNFRKTYNGRVNAGRTNAIWFTIGDDAAFREAIASNGTLEMTDAQQQKFRYGLQNGDNAIRKLFTCVALYGVE